MLNQNDALVPARLALRTHLLRPVIQRALRALLSCMARRRSRRALAALDDRLLRDIGLTRDEARLESRKGFWE